MPQVFQLKQVFRLKYVVAAALVAAATTSSSLADDTEILNLPRNSQIWETTPKGVAFAGLIGDRFVEPYMAMVRLPAGLVSPPHTKSANMFGVMISGSMVHSTVGSNPDDDVVLPEGSFFKIPKGLPHVSKCVSDVACVSFLYQDGKFDFLPVEN